MSIRMVAEMWDHAPTCWSTMDRHIMGVLAEFARDETRECWPGGSLLAHRLGIKEDSLSRAFRSLRDKGYEVRVPLGKDRKGNPVFAYEGARVRYRLPKLCPYPIHDAQTCWPEIQGRLEANTPVADGQRPDRCPASEGTGTSQRPDERPPTEGREPGRPSTRARTTVRQSPDGRPGHSFSDPSGEPSPPIGRDLEPNPWAVTPEEGKESPEDQKTNEQHVVTLLVRHAPTVAGPDRTKLNRATLSALVHGWSPEAVGAELAKPTNGLANVAYGLIARMKALTETEPPPPPAPPDPRDSLMCPLHPTRRAYHCNLCWGVVKGGLDPYDGCEGLRPDGWHETYRFRPKSAPEPDREFAPDDGPGPTVDQLARISAFLDNA